MDPLSTHQKKVLELFWAACRSLRNVVVIHIAHQCQFLLFPLQLEMGTPWIPYGVGVT
jgi:hypothetical protein